MRNYSRILGIVVVLVLLNGLLDRPTDEETPDRSQTAGMAFARQPPPSKAAQFQVKVTANPTTVEVGEKTKVVATVTRGGKPQAGAEVVFEAGGGEFQSSGKATGKLARTRSDGTCTDYWSYHKSTFAKGYGLSAKVSWKGETVRSEVLVRVVQKGKSQLRLTVTAQPATVEVGQRSLVVATVTHAGKPLAGAEVVFEAGDGLFQSSIKPVSKPIKTGKYGTCTDYWRYQKREFAKEGYLLSARASWKGEKARGEVRVRIGKLE
jgi:hypothetical protein